MIDLSTTYLGLKLKHPIVASASPLSQSLDGIRRLEDAGASAIVVQSLFAEQIEGESHLLDHYPLHSAESYAEAASYFPEMDRFSVGPHAYLELLRGAKDAVDIPIIGSLNGTTTGGWVDYARQMQEAGADAIELNIYFVATDPLWRGEEVESMCLNIVRAVKAQVSIPVAVKVGPHFSSFANMAKQFGDSGADALVLFNRFFQPDIHLDRLSVTPNLTLSSPHELRLPLRWVAILYGRVPVDFAITGGVHSYQDVLKGVMVGANVTMMASELLQRGVWRIREIVDEMTTWMFEREYDSVEKLRGSLSQRSAAAPSAFERANYMKALQLWRTDPLGTLIQQE